MNIAPSGQFAENRAGERHLQLLIECVTDYAIYMLDPTGIVSSWNAGAQRFKGYQAAEIIGQHFSRFFTPEDREAGMPQHVLATALRDGRFEAEGWRVRKDGRRFWASVVVDPIRDDDGSLVGFAKITRDITEKRETQLALEEARDALFQAQKLETIGKLTGSVAHDFNNLLQAIGSSLEMIGQRAGSHQTDIHRHLGVARSALETAGAVTQRLLAFARRQPLRPEPTDMARLVYGMAELVRRSVGEMVRVELSLADTGWICQVDPHQLESGILNLALNARDAMPGGGTLTIATANVTLPRRMLPGQTIEAGDYLMLSVSDTGIGMSADVLSRAVEPFFTTKPMGQGTGLGLSQLYGFIHQSGGFLEMESREGEGTTIKLYLPRLAGGMHHAAPGDEVVTQAPPPPPPVPQERPSILLVEDEVLIRLVLAEALTEQGYHVHQAGNGEEALPIISSGTPIDAMITDVGLPGMNGRLLAQLAHARRPRIKILFLTGYIDRADSEALPPGSALLCKPVSMVTLLARLRAVLSG
ncbi:PAS domain S-box protein [Niveispirillum fermenti]|uniref:PAS domain-containing sensor histidine kinase n=1 Tax=Niveispirillum fermenti TaxID=1233113 RepID=UPI003A866969